MKDLNLFTGIVAPLNHNAVPIPGDPDIPQP